MWLSGVFFWVGGLRCFKTDTTWHYYTNIVLVITRCGSQYVLLLVGVGASKMRMLNVYMCVTISVVFVCIFLISFFFFLQYERSRTATLTIQNAFECTWPWSHPGGFALGADRKTLLGFIYCLDDSSFYCSQFEELHTFALRRVCWRVSIVPTGFKWAIKALSGQKLYLSFK